MVSPPPQRISRSCVAVLASAIILLHLLRVRRSGRAQVRIYCTCDRSQRRVIKTTRRINQILRLTKFKEQSLQQPSLKVLVIDSIRRGCSTAALDQNKVDRIYPRECFPLGFMLKNKASVYRHAHECVH